MNLLFIILFAIAVQCADPFRWEFDMTLCGHISGGYDCFVPSNDKLTSTGSNHPYKRIDYQMYPHIFAIRSQGPDRWIVVMQSHSRKQKVDLNFGMVLHWLPADKQEVEGFLGCRVVDGQIELSSSVKLLETELIDSSFDDHHFFCDFSVKIRENAEGKKLIDIVSEQDKFALSVSLDGISQKYIDDYVPKDYPKDVYRYDKYKQISSAMHHFKKFECDWSAMKFNPEDLPKGGKSRRFDVFDENVECPDSRYILHIKTSKGRKIDSAKVKCEKGKYEFIDNTVSRWRTAYTLEEGETFSGYCHVEDSFLCPISIPCDFSNCPYVKVSLNTETDSTMDYRIICEEMLHYLIVGPREFSFSPAVNEFHCNADHNLVISKPSWYKDRDYPHPHTAATEAYCATPPDELPYYRTNCVRRNPLCHGKSCTIVKDDELYTYNVNCTNPNHKFQEFSMKNSRWYTRTDMQLYCDKSGEWDTEWFHPLTDIWYARCKDASDTTPPIEYTKWLESQEAAKKEKEEEEQKGKETTNNNGLASKDSTAANGQTINVFSIALAFVFPILIVH